MISKVKKLTVKYNGETVGYLADLDDGIAFQYDEKWATNGRRFVKKCKRNKTVVEGL